MSYINVKNVSKTIKGTPILKNVSFTIDQGTITGFVGENGSGKTMLFRALLGLIKVEGEISIADQPIKLNASMPVNTGAIIETPGFINSYTALNNLRYLAAIKNLVGDDEIIEAMKVFGLDEKKDLKVKKYSLGMRQKLAIIQAYMENQELLILDEPTNGLDDDAIAIFKAQMKKLAAEGKTILIASHDKDVIEDLAGKIYRMKSGVLTPVSEN